MPERCVESWRLWHEMEVQQLMAREEGYPVDEMYKPFELALRDYQAHFRTCPQCRAWVDSWGNGVKK